MYSVPRIYIAPSCQTWNVGKYALYDTNEAKMCNKITSYIVKELEKYHCGVYRGYISTGLAGNERRANELKCRSYYAIHTNAGPSTAHGVTALYQSWSGFSLRRRAKSKLMATELCKAIASMGRYNRGAVVGKKQSDGREYFGDLRVPDMASTILEIEFHTNLDATAWLVSNPAKIGVKIAQTIAKIEKLFKIYPATVTAKDGLSVRKGAGVSYEKIGTLKYGTVVTVYGEKLNGLVMWCRIHPTEDMWVSKRFLRS